MHLPVFLGRSRAATVGQGKSKTDSFVWRLAVDQCKMTLLYLFPETRLLTSSWPFGCAKRVIVSLVMALSSYLKRFRICGANAASAKAPSRRLSRTTSAVDSYIASWNPSLLRHYVSSSLQFHPRSHRPMLNQLPLIT